MSPRWKRPDMANRIDHDRLNRLADLVADGLTITAAAAQIGVSMQRCQHRDKNGPVTGLKWGQLA